MDKIKDLIVNLEEKELFLVKKMVDDLITKKDPRDIDLRYTLELNDILNVVITCCNTGKQHKELWKFIYNSNNKCISPRLLM